MVCIPCIVIPLFLWIFHRFLQPLIMPYLPEKMQRWFNIRMKGYGIVKDGDTDEAVEGDANETTEQKSEAEEEGDTTSNGSAMKCPFTQNGSAAKEVVAGGDKKTD